MSASKKKEVWCVEYEVVDAESEKVLTTRGRKYVTSPNITRALAKATKMLRGKKIFEISYVGEAL